MPERRYQIEYGATTEANIARLPKRVRQQIFRKIERLEHGLHGDIKQLRGADVGYRLRSGDYRILFDVERDTIVIQRIGHRKQIYD